MSKPVIPVLNHLIEVCRNGQYGFRQGAEAVNDQHLAAILLGLSEQREQFAAQLRYQVSLNGGRPEDHGTLAGALHRRWIDLRSTVAPRVEHVVIAECERGERFALKAYSTALEAALPAPVRKTLEDQYLQIRAAQQLVASLHVKLSQQPCF
jgi:uncharacterized protein (TIGR02284 family)